jgi:4-carboxymuconolactone decarboxylase
MTDQTAVESRYESAGKVLDKLFTPAWREQSTAPASPAVAAFGKIGVEHCYADAWGRDTLDFRTRSVICLTALATMGGCHEELKMHVRAGITNGLAPDDVVEIFIHLISYVGVPKMVQAMRAAGEVFAEQAKAKAA